MSSPRWRPAETCSRPRPTVLGPRRRRSRQRRLPPRLQHAPALLRAGPAADRRHARTRERRRRLPPRRRRRDRRWRRRHRTRRRPYCCSPPAPQRSHPFSPTRRTNDHNHVHTGQVRRPSAAAASAATSGGSGASRPHGVIAALATAAIVFRLTQGRAAPVRLHRRRRHHLRPAAHRVADPRLRASREAEADLRSHDRHRPARGHREHHEDPSNLDLVFVPPWAFLYVTPITTVLVLLFIRPWHLAATVLMVSELMLLTYEWTHYLIHTNYKPKRRYYKHLWRNHRLHHYRNEHYWFGVTRHTRRQAARTSPKKSDVPVSPTARTLGREPADGSV